MSKAFCAPFLSLLTCLESENHFSGDMFEEVLVKLNLIPVSEVLFLHFFSIAFYHWVSDYAQ